MTNTDMTIESLIDIARDELNRISEIQRLNKRACKCLNSISECEINRMAKAQRRVQQFRRQIKFINYAIKRKDIRTLTLIERGVATDNNRRALIQKLHQSLDTKELETLRGMLHHSIEI